MAPRIVVILVGMYFMAGAAFNWDWFMEHRNTRFITVIFGGRTGARIFYFLAGLGLILLGLFGYLKIVDFS